MLTKIKTAALSALIGLGTLAAIPASAQADGLYLNFGGGPRFGMYAGDRDWRPRDWRRSCTADRALDKADRMGIYRARVVGEDRYTIRVAGRKFGDRVVVAFGREPSCPILRR